MCKVWFKRRLVLQRKINPFNPQEVHDHILAGETVICLKLALKEQLLAFGILEPVYSHKLDQHLASESWQSKRPFKSAQDSKK